MKVTDETLLQIQQAFGEPTRFATFGIEELRDRWQDAVIKDARVDEPDDDVDIDVVNIFLRTELGQESIHQAACYRPGLNIGGLFMEIIGRLQALGFSPDFS